MRKMIEKFKDMRELFYLKVMKKPRLYFYPTRYLSNYDFGVDLSAILPYRKIRTFNLELIEFCRNIK